MVGVITASDDHLRTNAGTLGKTRANGAEPRPPIPAPGTGHRIAAQPVSLVLWMVRMQFAPPPLSSLNPEPEVGSAAAANLANYDPRLNIFVQSGAMPDDAEQVDGYDFNKV